MLITRPEPGAQETAARVAEMGAQPVLAPMLRIAPRTLRLPTAPLAAVLVTSGNAIAALPDGLHDVPLFAVGAATAARACAAGFVRAESADGDATALAALVTARLPAERGTLLLASGARQGAALADALRAAGFRVARRVAYAAHPATALPVETEALLRDGVPLTALFFSAETAHAFVRLVRRAALGEGLRDSEAVSIGKRAGVALEALPWRRIRVATRPTQDEMLALLR